MIAALLFTAAFASAPWAQPSPPQAQKGKAASNRSAAGDEAARGKILYRENCEVCHFSSSDEKKIGPGLKGLYKHGIFSDGKKVDDAAMRVWIEKGGKNMPGFANTLKPDQIRALIAYLRTL